MLKATRSSVPTGMLKSAAIRSNLYKSTFISNSIKTQRLLLSTKNVLLDQNHNQNNNNNNNSKLSQGFKDLQKDIELEKQRRKLFQNDPHLQKLADDFSSNDHIHLRESETEFNDCFTLDGKQHAKNIAFNSSLKQYKTTLNDQNPISSNSLSHSHSHSEPNPLLVLSLNEIKKNPAVRITWVGLAMNIGIALGKFVGGVVFHSQALLADSVHAASDLISDVLTLFSVNWAEQKPNENFPYGYGKIETLGSLAVSTILTVAGISIGWSSICAIVGPIVPHTILETITTFLGHSHTHSSHSHIVTEDITNINAAWIAAGSIVMKEWIFQATKKIAHDTKSNVLLANAWHHRVDSLTSLVALVAITSSYFFGIQSLDSIGGLLVSGLVIKAGTSGIVSSMNELIDKSLPNTDERYIEVETIINESLSKLISNNNSDKSYKISKLTVMLSGRNIRINTILEAPLQKWDNVLDVKELENVTTYLRTMIKQNIPHVVKVDVEFIEEVDPSEENNEEENHFVSHDHPNNHHNTHDHMHTHTIMDDSSHTHKH